MQGKQNSTAGRLAAAGFRVIPDEEGPIEKVVDLLSDYRPHLIALCSRLDGPTARTLAEVKEPARDESSEGEMPPYHLARSTAAGMGLTERRMMRKTSATKGQGG